MVMTTDTARFWWVPVVRGIFAIIFGVLAFALPGIALATLILMFGIYVGMDGIFSLISAFREHGRKRWGSLIEGIVGILVALVTFVVPGLTGLTLLYLIAAWAVITGIMEIIVAIEIRNEIDDELWLGISGVLSILFGIVLMVYPSSGAVAVVWLIATYAILFGFALVALGFRLRDHKPTVFTPDTASDAA